MVNFFKILILSSFVMLSACMRSVPIIEQEHDLSAAQIEEDSMVESAEPAKVDEEPSTPPEAAEAPAVAMVNPQTISGAWRLNVGEQLCQIFTTHTKLNQGFRASTRLCPAPLNTVHSWQIKDNQLNLLNSANEIIVSLVLQPAESDDSPAPSLNFVGKLADGTNVSLSR
ncbi:MAG: AprI/Inh family metalloprotease inhibitor [Alphaproteobacteria bacterium]|nr:AprI/Inh family metalloprotease inhibitor [Alphaproteobacteria bacterium]